MQRWTIIDAAAGAVLCPCFETEGPDAHPRDCGWPWQDSQAAVAIDAVPDTTKQVFNGAAWVPGGPSSILAIYPTMLSRLAYQRLFTQQERIAVRASTDPIVIDFRELAALPETVDLADADVIAGTRYLETLALIGAGRAETILSGQAPA